MAYIAILLATTAVIAPASLLDLGAVLVVGTAVYFSVQMTAKVLVDRFAGADR